MPRGARAVHDVAGVGPDADCHTRSAVLHENLLVCQCWCTRTFVLVHRIDLLDGNTGSCGRVECCPPDGSEAANSVRLIPRGSGWRIVDAVRAGIHIDRSSVDDNLVLLGRRGRFIPELRCYAPEKRVRKDFVAALYAQRKHPIDIALLLDVPVVVVRDDLHNLRSQGRVA